MALSVKRRGRGTKRALMSEMNMTPMIDVMLVLLVIFMVTAPLLTVGVKVNLPTANAPNIGNNDTPIVVNINHQGQIFIGDIEVDVATLPAKLRAITNENLADVKIFVKGDKSISYGSIMNVMGSISSAGFKKVVLVTELPKKIENVTSQTR